jgi:hypothetical protein
MWLLFVIILFLFVCLLPLAFVMCSVIAPKTPLCVILAHDAALTALCAGRHGVRAARLHWPLARGLPL